MITAQEAKNLVAATVEVAEALTSIEAKITEAANSGLLFVEEGIEDEILAIKITGVLDGLGFTVDFQSSRNILKIKW